MVIANSNPDSSALAYRWTDTESYPENQETDCINMDNAEDAAIDPLGNN